MSRLKDEILQNMEGLEQTSEQQLAASFTFPEDFVGFQGHFPGNKILPGICQIQCVIIMLEQWKKRRVALMEVVQAKFTAPVSPGEKITCECKNIIENENELKVKASVTRDQEKVADLRLKISLGSVE